MVQDSWNRLILAGRAMHMSVGSASRDLGYVQLKRGGLGFLAGQLPIGQVLSAVFG